MFLSPLVTRLVQLSLEEDLPEGDVTSEACLAADSQADAVVIAREGLVVCGLPLIEVILSEIGADVRGAFLVTEGEEVEEGTPLAQLSGNARSILAAERTVLNFLQRLSGIATLTRAVVEAAQGITVLDTRKTTPGWRALEKYAVRTGGGRNHRSSLSDMILIKNNHIDAAGSIKAAMARVRERQALSMKVEVEVRSIAELRQALACGADMVMLDNMNDQEIGKALEVIRSASRFIPVEVSGGVTPERFPALSKLGVPFVSLGGLTTRAQNVDISMRILKTVEAPEAARVTKRRSKK